MNIMETCMEWYGRCDVELQGDARHDERKRSRKVSTAGVERARWVKRAKVGEEEYGDGEGAILPVTSPELKAR